MKFYKLQARRVSGKKPPQNAEYPCVVLFYDNWDDYGYKTYFDMHYYDDNANLQFKKSIKNLHISEYDTNIRQIFDSLDKDYVSLGQDMEYRIRYLMI
ncbi:hypothetical protein ACEYW6_24330 [Nostoc sp. UIC 10607]